MNIFTAMTAAMQDIGAIAKADKNVMQGFMYRSIDAVYNSMHEILAKHNIFTVPDVLEERTEERQSKSGGTLIYRILKMKYTFYTDDGSNVSCTVIGEGMDSGDKAANKAMSISHKYALFQTFLIPTEDEKDPDAQSHEVKPKPKEELEKKVDPPVEKKPNSSGLDQKQKQLAIKTMLDEMYINELDAGKELLRMTTWTDKDGNEHAGKSNPFDLNIKPSAKGKTQTDVYYQEVKKTYDQWAKAMQKDFPEEVSPADNSL